MYRVLQKLGLITTWASITMVTLLCVTEQNRNSDSIKLSEQTPTTQSCRLSIISL